MKFEHIISVGVLSAALAFSANADANSFSATQTADIQKIVHDYIVNNPTVLVEASQKLREQMQAKEQKAALSAIESNKQSLFNDSASPIAGNAQGSVVIVEFFDYQCGHCKEMGPVIDQFVQNNRQIKVIFKELPIFGGDSEFAARASLAAYKIDPQKFVAFHNALMKANNPLKNEDVMKIAKSLGYDSGSLKKAMSSADVMDQLKKNFALAQQLELAGTPAFVIANGSLTKFQFVPGAAPAAQLQDLIQKVS